MDLPAAYDSTVRELLVESGDGALVRQQLDGAGFGSDVVNEVVEQVQEHGAVLSRLGVEER
eukprot:1545941-Alexandrium_andersonii.AAC.1